MASSEHLGGNKYKIYVELGKDSNGKRIRPTKTVTVTSPRDLKNKMSDFESECKKKVEEANNNLENITFNEFIDRWWKVHILESVAISTRNDYSYFVPMVKEYFGKMKLRNIKRLNIDEFFMREKELGRKSLSRKMNMLKNIFGMAIVWEVLVSNPMNRYKLKGKVEPPVREIFNSNELELFFSLLDNESERNRLMLLAASLGALRRGEVLGFGEDVMDYKNNTVNITRSLNWDRDLKVKYLGPTKGKKDRKITYPESFMKELRLYAFKQNELRWQFGDQWELIGDVDLLFRTSYGTIMHPQSFTNLWKKICIRLDIKKIGLHDLRHSAATYLIRNGTDMKIVQEFLGHQDITTTMNTYVHTTEEDVSKPAQAFEKLL